MGAPSRGGPLGWELACSSAAHSAPYPDARQAKEVRLPPPVTPPWAQGVDGALWSAPCPGQEAGLTLTGKAGWPKTEQGTWWTEHGQGSENHPGEVAGRTRLGRVTRFSPCPVSLPERGAEPCDPPGPHLWRRATHAQRSPRGKLRGHRPVRAARPGPRLVPFRLCRLAVCDPGHVTCIPGASISPRYANYSSEKK